MAVKREAAPQARVTIPGTKVTLVKRDGTHPLVPEIDPTYIFRPTLVEEVAFAIECKQNCMLVGDAGTGKSTLVEQIAAQTNHPLRRVNLHGETDTSLFVGREKPTEIDGKRTLEYRWGILATAMAEGQWLLLDEFDAGMQPVLFVLQSVLEDGGKLLLEDGLGTVVRKHPDFRIFATANTVGVASRNKLMYSGTMNRLNEATLDRFGAIIHVEALNAEDEEKLIAERVPALDRDFVQAIVRIARDVRSQLKNEQLACTMSTRRCLQWAQAMTMFHPVRAARLTFLNKLSAEDGAVLESVVQKFFGSAPNQPQP